MKTVLVIFTLVVSPDTGLIEGTHTEKVETPSEYACMSLEDRVRDLRLFDGTTHLKYAYCVEE